MGSCGDENACALEVCDNACVDFDNDPLNCGDCGEICAVDQICFGGQCWDYEPAAGCDSCDGCDVCGQENCCELADYGVSCVDSDLGCP
jgi:hypothetical protein